MNLNDEPKIIGMANALDLDTRFSADAIIEYCRQKVANFLRHAGRIEKVVDLQRIVCERLNLKVHEIWSDLDIETLAQSFFQSGEIAALGAVKSQLGAETLGMLVKLKHSSADGRAQFVAFVDCRGDKHQRRVFTLWHEIAHCLSAEEQLALPLRKTTIESIQKDPVEKLTDKIASDFAFYDPLFRPVLASELEKAGKLTFSVVEHVRDRFNPEASFASTLNACVTKTDLPIILIEAGLALKKAEQRRVDAGLATAEEFVPSLRVLRAIPNELARKQLPCIPKQIRVPVESVIARVHSGDLQTILDGGSAAENLQAWTISTGGGLPFCEVTVETRNFGENVLALIAQAA